MLKAEKIVEASNGIAAPPNKVHVNTLLMLIESSNYWIVMAEMVDDDAKTTMQAAAVDVSQRR